MLLVLVSRLGNRAGINLSGSVHSSSRRWFSDGQVTTSVPAANEIAADPCHNRSPEFIGNGVTMRRASLITRS